MRYARYYEDGSKVYGYIADTDVALETCDEVPGMKAKVGPCFKVVNVHTLVICGICVNQEEVAEFLRLRCGMKPSEIKEAMAKMEWLER